MKVLVIAAHMDDEVLGPGGTVVRHRRVGDHVCCCIVSERAYEHEYRAEEAGKEIANCRAAAEVLGYQKLWFLELKDERLDQRLIDVIVPIERVINEYKPDVVYTHHRGDLNQDHRAVHQAVMVACRPHAPHVVNRILCFEVPSSTDQAPSFGEHAFLPNYYVDVSETLELKQRALECYKRELRTYPHPRSTKGLRVFAEKRGMEVGCAAAEAFVSVRELWKD